MKNGSAPGGTVLSPGATVAPWSSIPAEPAQSGFVLRLAAQGASTAVQATVTITNVTSPALAYPTANATISFRVSAYVNVDAAVRVAWPQFGARSSSPL